MGRSSTSTSLEAGGEGEGDPSDDNGVVTLLLSIPGDSGRDDDEELIELDEELLLSDVAARR